MSALIPDNVLKAPFVQQIQERDADIVRSSQQSQHAFQEEMSRQGSESVRETGETDQNGIDEDPERDRSGGRKKKRRAGQMEADGEKAAERDLSPMDDGRPHKINIIA